MLSGEQAYNEVKQIWMDQISKYPNNVTVLMNAADYLRFANEALANQLMEKAKAIDPKTVSEKQLSK